MRDIFPKPAKNDELAREWRSTCTTHQEPPVALLMQLCLGLPLLPQRGRKGLGVGPCCDLDVFVGCREDKRFYSHVHNRRLTRRRLFICTLLAGD